MQIEFTPRGLLATFFRQRKKFFSIFFVIVALGLAYVLLAVPKYEGSGSLLVKFGEHATPDINRVGGKPTELSQNDRREIMQSHMDILQSHDLLVALVKDIGVERLYPGLTKKVEGKDSPVEVASRLLATKDLSTRSALQSNLIDVSVLNPDPMVARDTIKRLIDLFIARQTEVYNKPQLDFLEEQVHLAETHLQDSQRSLQDFKTSMGISSIEEEMQQLLRDKGDAAKIAFQGLDDTEAKIVELQGKEAELLMTYRADSPAVQQVRRSIAVAQGSLSKRRNDLQAGADQGKGVLANRLAKIDERIAALEAQRTQYNDLVRQVEIDEENYKAYKLRLEEARVNDTLNEKSITRIAVVDEPAVTSRPVRPRKKLIMAATILAAGLIAAAAAILFETLDERFGTPMHLGYTLKVPVLACFNAKRGA